MKILITLNLLVMLALASFLITRGNEMHRVQAFLRQTQKTEQADAPATDITGVWRTSHDSLPTLLLIGKDHQVMRIDSYDLGFPVNLGTDEPLVFKGAEAPVGTSAIYYWNKASIDRYNGNGPGSDQREEYQRPNAPIIPSPAPF